MDPNSRQLRPTDHLIAVLKASGMKNRHIGELVYPNQTTHSAEVSVADRLKKPLIQQQIKATLEKYGVNVEKAIKPVADALDAKKVTELEGDFYETDVPDHKTRLAAHDRAMKLLKDAEFQSSLDGDDPFAPSTPAPQSVTNNFITLTNKDREEFGL